MEEQQNRAREWVFRKDWVEKTTIVLITETTPTTFIELGTKLCASCALTPNNILGVHYYYYYYSPFTDEEPCRGYY